MCARESVLTARTDTHEPGKKYVLVLGSGGLIGRPLVTLLRAAGVCVCECVCVCVCAYVHARSLCVCVCMCVCVC